MFPDKSWEGCCSVTWFEKLDILRKKMKMPEQAIILKLVKCNFNCIRQVGHGQIPV